MCAARGIARHTHAAEPERLYLAQIHDAPVHRPHRGLADADQPIRVRRAVLGDPAVVRAEAGLPMVEVRVVAQHHPTIAPAPYPGARKPVKLAGSQSLT